MLRLLNPHIDVSERSKYKTNSRVFPKIDHSGSAATIVIEENKFSKTVTSNRD